jgi:hypothetical protein
MYCSDDRKKSRRDPQPSNKRMHSQGAVDILKEWLLSAEHVEHPYPTEEEKKVIGQYIFIRRCWADLIFLILSIKDLMEITGLDRKQLTNWFTNARKRIWQPKYGRLPKQNAVLKTQKVAAPPMIKVLETTCQNRHCFSR